MFDQYARRLAGDSLPVQRAAGRVIWTDGLLYVFTVAANRAAGPIFVYESAVPEATERPRGGYAAAGVSWVKAPCPCGFPGSWRRTAVVLVAEADGLIDAGDIVVQVQETADA